MIAIFVTIFINLNILNLSKILNALTKNLPLLYKKKQLISKSYNLKQIKPKEK